MIAPTVLTCHLKRFNKYMEKINRPIEFHEILDIGPYLNSSVDKKRKESCKYKLFGVVVHRGYDLFSGHYYAYVRGLDGNWYQANDESMSPVSLTRVLKENAYILLYQRQNLPVKKPTEASLLAAEAPLAKNKGEAQKLAKSMLAEVCGNNGKSSSNGVAKEIAIPKVIESPIEDKTPSTDGKSPTDMEADLPRPARMFIPTGKRRRIQRLVQSLQREKIVKFEEKKIRIEEAIIDELVKMKQQFFKAENEIDTWENVEEPEQRQKLMQVESKNGEVRSKNALDVEYDKGKTKKIRNKGERKLKGLKEKLDLIQQLMKTSMGDDDAVF